MLHSLARLIDRLVRRARPPAPSGIAPAIAAPRPAAPPADPGRAADQPPAEVRYLMIVARGQIERFHQMRTAFRTDPTVHVLLDRRHAQRRRASRAPVVERRRGERRHSPDYWEDPTIHPVVLVAVGQRTAGSLTAAWTGRTPAHLTEGQRMDPTVANEARDRVLVWIQDGQHVLGRIIPGLFEENESLRRRLLDAEREAERLRHDNERLRGELANLREEHETTLGRQTEMVDSLGRFVTSMSQTLEPMRALAQKLQAPTRRHP